MTCAHDKGFYDDRAARAARCCSCDQTFAAIHGLLPEPPPTRAPQDDQPERVVNITFIMIGILLIVWVVDSILARIFGG